MFGICQNKQCVTWVTKSFFTVDLCLLLEFISALLIHYHSGPILRGCFFIGQIRSIRFCSPYIQLVSTKADIHILSNTNLTLSMRHVKHDFGPTSRRRNCIEIPMKLFSFRFLGSAFIYLSLLFPSFFVCHLGDLKRILNFYFLVIWLQFYKDGV